MDGQQLKTFLDKKVDEYNRPAFIKQDPISVPHRYSGKQDIEIAAFLAAVFSWGGRTTIINKSNELMSLMDDRPFCFIIEHREQDLKRLLHFKHRTFTTTDLLYFIAFLRMHYHSHESLETAFSKHMQVGDYTIEKALDGFYDYFFSLPDSPARTRKHIAAPQKKSTCKRLNMFLRWMVRQDEKGVDFGLWKDIRPSQLVCPVDLHVARVARKLGLVQRKQTDWETAMELTAALRKLDKDDPVKYDFALFNLGIIEKF